MNTSISSFFHLFKPKRPALLIILMILVSSVSAGAVKTKDGSATAMKLQEYITEHSATEVGIFRRDTYSEATVPRILLTGGPEVVLTSGTGLTLFDPMASKILNTFRSPVNGVWKIFPSASPGIVYLSGSAFARFNLTSGKTVWKRNFGMAGTYYLSVQYGVRFPPVFNELPGKNRISVIGLVQEQKTFKYLNRIMLLNASDGSVPVEWDYHYRRQLNGSMEIFINTDTGEYEILNTQTMESYLRGLINLEDLINAYDHAAVDKNRLGFTDNIQGQEFNAHLLEKGFILTSYENYDIWGGVKNSKWSFYDEKGNRTRVISPAPLTSFDLAVANLGQEEWPVYLLHTLNKKMRRTRVDRIIALEKDGSYTEIEMPEIEGIKEFLLYPVAAWFHKGKDFYYLKYGGIYTFRIGGKTGRLLYKADKSERCDRLSAWDTNHVMLTNAANDNETKAVIIRTSDGEKIPPEQYSNELNSVLWKMAADHDQSVLPLPDPGFVPGFKKYWDYNCTRDIDVKQKRANNAKAWKGVRMFKVWGDYRLTGRYGDIGIVAASMDDKSTALIGISIADNRPLFSVPVMEFTGLYSQDYSGVFPQGNYLPFNILRLNNEEALLIVLENIGRVKIYKLKRP